MQGNDTKTLNLNKDFEELMSKAQQTGSNGSRKTKKFWTRRRRRPVIEMICAQSPRMESIMKFVAEWVSVEEMKVLQGLC